MRRLMLKSKIHRATVTAASIDYEGSISIDSSLMAAADILPYEQVHVFDVANGARLVTYAIPGSDGEICVNGAAARLVDVGDEVIIASFCDLAAAEIEDFRPRLVYVDSDNLITDTNSPAVGGFTKAVPASGQEGKE
jgi:aspartate 1-decarboxylase